MNTEQFKVHGKDVVDYICNYTTTLQDRKVAPTIDPGYLKKIIPCKRNLINLLKCFIRFICPSLSLKTENWHARWGIP